MRSTSQPYEVLARRADGRGSVRLANGYDPSLLELVALSEFERDHSITMCWVRHKHSNTLSGDVLTRDPPGMDGDAA